jgi:hypothetical protein
LTETSNILPQKRQPCQGPIDHPRPAGIHGDEAGGVIFQGIIEIAYMIVTLECRYSKCIEGALLAPVEAPEKGEAFLEGRILQIDRLRHERVADGRRLREQGWDPRPGCLLAGHFPDRM